MVLDITAFSKVKGCRVRLQVNEDEYEGVVVNVIRASLCVALGKVHCLTDGARYHLLYFYTYEIESCAVVNGPEELKNSKKSSDITEEDGPRLVKLRPLPFHKRGKANANIESNNLLIEGTDDNKNEHVQEEISDNSDDEDNDVLPCEKFRYPVPSTNVIIDAINDDFQQAISDIKSETTVGVSIEGEGVGRHGKICWISISTESHIYLFDILAFGKDAFDNGLRDDIFQNQSLLKVFHDCRKPSDALYHLFETSLVNIFDTQSSDALLHYKMHNKMPRYVRSLTTCIKDYLKLQINIPELSRTRYQKNSEKSTSVWIHRPLPKRYLRVAAKHCMFLKELRYCILERYIADLNHGAEIFLSIVRNSSEQELDLTLSTLDMLPAMFEKLETRNRNAQRHRSYDAPLVDSKFCEFSETSDPYAAADSFFQFKNGVAKMEESKTVTTATLLEKSPEYKNEAPKSDGEFQIANGPCKPNDSMIPTPSKEKKCSSTDSGNEVCSALFQSRKHPNEPLPSTGNQSYARSHPKKRLDWPKVSSQTPSSAAHVSVIPAGMMSPRTEFLKKKQDS